ncbi:uncharacterized protein K460DRAFT_407126 [Cucurbitaria berberidis CBS 394.84]|uniref:C2H2-type domain-containing protein n=1 Tax=Cucurbitaria berberidis CBS 394.84 TaxID=1168544 RepID=A0A9P4L5J7_9PLEO|nr:uncharacterized protein K460DRAFT_407126 [Cucurbitaria berberidis CBS 394.84]KAF1842735.1 hypothetical protein K460DRAFT_407126 [Cucurbitaria berberidis CBS 394.84]
MVRTHPDDGRDQPWSPQNNEGYSVPTNTAWVRGPGVNEIRQQYGVQLTPRSDMYTTNWSHEAFASTNTNAVPYHLGGGFQELTAATYNATGSGSEWRSPQAGQQRQIYPPGHGLPENYQYEYQRTSYPDHGYHSTTKGQDGRSSYAPQAGRLTAQEIESLNIYDPSTASASTSPHNPSSNGTQYNSTEGQQTGEDTSVACPYHCGTVLTGMYAHGNLTRHLKSQACEGSGKEKVKYPCPISGCGKEYIRKDGLSVHMRRQHGAPPASQVRI